MNINWEWWKQKQWGLPRWAWAVIAAGIIVLAYRHFRNSSASSSTDTSAQDQTPVDTGTGTGVGAGSLVPTPGGDIGGDIGGVAPSAQGTDTLPVFDIQIIPPDSSTTLPTDPGQATTTTIAPPAKPSKTQSGKDPFGNPVLYWGGQAFSTKSAFKAWAAMHGSSVAKELLLHPKAAAIYASLPAGSPAGTVGAKLLKGGKKSRATLVTPHGGKMQTSIAGRKVTPARTPQVVQSVSGVPITKVTVAQKSAPAPAPNYLSPSYVANNPTSQVGQPNKIISYGPKGGGTNKVT